MSEGAGSALILRRQAPASRMPRGVQFRHHPHPPSLRISNNLPDFLGSVGLLWRVRSVLGDLRVRVQYQREGILVHDMPVQNVHFVVHHSVYGFVDQAHWEEVARGVDHQSAVAEGRPIFDHQRQVSQHARGVLVPGTSDGLHEGFQPPHKPNISIGFDLGTVPQNLKLVAFLLSCENRLKFRIGDIHFHLVAESFCL